MRQARWHIEDIEVTGYGSGGYTLSVVLCDGAQESELALGGTVDDGMRVSLDQTPQLSTADRDSAELYLARSGLVHRLLSAAIEAYAGASEEP
jgi:ABC-type iron transport system FetAB ATPase subunit